jgi:hypothetical protein
MGKKQGSKQAVSVVQQEQKPAPKKQQQPPPQKQAAPAKQNPIMQPNKKGGNKGGKK